MDINLVNYNISNKLSLLDERTLPWIDEGAKCRFFYISDLHIDDKVVGLNFKDKLKYLKNTVLKLKKDFYYDQECFIDKFLIIAGDVSHDYNLLRDFYTELVKHINPHKIITIIGNHELWFKNDFGLKNLDDIILFFRRFFQSFGITFLYNDLAVYKKNRIKVIRNIDKISEKQLRDECFKSSFRILGGIGFSGYNKKYNAEYGLYRSIIKNNKEDLYHTQNFEMIYKKVVSVLSDYQIICITHNPISDWGKDDYYQNCVYLSGHTHINGCICLHNKRHFFDNQVGRKRKNMRLKYFELESICDIFKNYEDGVYKITRDKYLEFYRGFGYGIEFNSIGDVYLVKRCKYYMFFLYKNNKFYLLNGGRVRSIKIQDLVYYYRNLEKYAVYISKFLRDYNNSLKSLSEKIAYIGGRGTIHGCIVDIDFYNHIYLNPIDLKETYYYAETTGERVVYKNFVELLNKRIPRLYNKLIKQLDCNKNDLIIKEEIVEVIDETKIYRMSNIIRSLQYTTNNMIVRNWNDKVLENDKAIGYNPFEILFDKH